MRLLVVRWMVVSFLGMVSAQQAQDAAELAPGQELYQRNCGQCHGTFDQSARRQGPIFAAASPVRLAVALPYGVHRYAGCKRNCWRAAPGNGHRFTTSP
jgi:mono/diheme cytochrome c family protein